jgi:hypothetical protein
MNNTTQQDQWEIALDKQILIINQCQLENSLSSCTKCPKILDCTIRKQYVKSVYESMSKGASGGFEF